MERYDEHVEDVLVNVSYALSPRSLSRLLGPEQGAAYRERAERTERALLELCWDERRGLFYDLAGPAGRPVRVSTWPLLAPLVLPSLPEEVARRLVEEHLLDPRRYRAPTGSLITAWGPATPASDPRLVGQADCDKERWRAWRTAGDVPGAPAPVTLSLATVLPGELHDRSIRRSRGREDRAA